MRARLSACLWSILCVGCPPSTIDPAPPLDTEGGSEADNPLLDDAPLSCEDRKHNAEEHVLEAIAAGVEGCETDADCTRLDPETRCYDSCPQVIAAHAAARVGQAVRDADERWCDGFDVQCSAELPPPPDCTADAPHCVEGRCTGEPAE